MLSRTLFEIATLPEAEIGAMRAEVIQALQQEGGWTKKALLRFGRIDSALTEVGRVFGLAHGMFLPVNFTRACITDWRLEIVLQWDPTVLLWRTSVSVMEPTSLVDPRS